MFLAGFFEIIANIFGLHFLEDRLVLDLFFYNCKPNALLEVVSYPGPCAVCSYNCAAFSVLCFSIEKIFREEWNVIHLVYVDFNAFNSNCGFFQIMIKLESNKGVI